MGDWEDIEDARLLKKNYDSYSQSIKSQSHCRSASYGTFLPTFAIDVNTLIHSLPPFLEIPDISRLSPPDTDDTNDNKEDKPPERTHRRIDSVISPTLEYSGDRFKSILERELDSLFTFVSLQFSRVTEDMERFEIRREVTEKLLKPNPYSINNKSGIDNVKDNVSSEEEIEAKDNDSGIEDDHLNSPHSFLSRIKEALSNLKRNLEKSLRQLDELVGIYDKRTQEDSARDLFNTHQAKSMELHQQIDQYLNKIDTKLKQYECDDDKKRSAKLILEFKALEKAKKERMTFIDILGFLLLIVSSATIIYFSLSVPKSRWIILLRLLRSPMMIVLYMFLLGFNMMAWARVDINYVSIFDFPRKSIPTPRFLFRMGSLFSVLFAAMLVACLVAGTQVLYISDKVTGTMMWVAILLFWVNPLDILNRLGRYSFLLVFVRVLIAPLPVVLFADFWFADQLNSILAFLLDLQYYFCYSFTPSSWEQGPPMLKSCTMVSNGIRPIISCLPALWRLLQCLRCFQKTRKVAHLFNAVKYFTTFPVVLFATFFAVTIKPFSSLRDINFDQTGWMIVCWLVSSLVHALYCFYWDIVMDWGLLDLRQGHILRRSLLYRRWTYVVAFFVDFIIRFACVAKLTLAIVYHIDSDVIYTLLVLSEMLRRVMWNFFRIEYEHVLRSNS